MATIRTAPTHKANGATTSNDRLTSEEAKRVRRGEAQLKRRQSKSWLDVKDALTPNRDEDRWVADLIQDAKAEQATNPMSRAELLAESERLSRAGEKHAKRLGIKTDVRSANRIIHEYRKARKRN